MKRGKSKASDIKSRLAKLENYIDDTVLPCIPLVLEGRKIVVDKKALESALPKQIASLFPGMPPKKRERLKGKLVAHFSRVAGRLPFDPAELANETVDPKRTLIMAVPEKLAASKGCDKQGQIDWDKKGRIYEEWFCVRHALVTAGAKLEIVEASPNSGGFREVFTRDRYVMINGTAYLPDPQKLLQLRPRYTPESADYIGQMSQMEEALHARGVETVTVKGAWFEGGNVVRHFGSRTLFTGIAAAWFSLESAQKLLAAVNENEEEKWSLMPVILANYTDMYHMDTGMSEELPRGEVMLSPLLTDSETCEIICDIVGQDNVIELTDDEAKTLATNMIDVGDTLVMTGACASLEEKLTARGYSVITPADYGRESFMVALGGVHCMTNDIPQPLRKPQAPRV